MGAQPLLAMNIVCFPDCLEIEILEQILKGGESKVIESGALLVGGHTVEDDEPKYGLSVTGIVHPDGVLVNSAARVGDYLILTKPIGLGILNTAIKVDMASEEQYNAAVKTMITLNKYAIEALRDFNISSCTDVTGFGFLGHACEMAKGSGVSLEVYSDKVPIIEGAEEFVNMGIIPAGAYSNKNYIGNDIEVEEGVEEAMLDLLCDPQTSGGLLVAIQGDDVEEALEKLSAGIDTEFAVVGKVIDKKDKAIYIRK